MYYAYVSANENKASGFCKMLKRYKSTKELLEVTEDSGVYKYILPLCAAEQTSKYAVACTQYTILEMKKHGIYSVVIDKELSSLIPIFISLGIENIDGSNLHKLMLPQILKLLTKDKNINLSGIQIAISSPSENDIMYLISKLFYLDAEFVLIGDSRLEPVADKIFEEYGIPARVTTTLRHGILLYLGGFIPQISGGVEVIDLGKTMIKKSFTDIIIDTGKLPVSNLTERPTIAVTEMFLRLTYKMPLSDAYTKSGCRVKGIKYR